ncbi:MAG TPA: hypothetical protein VIS07_18570 [Candidatus Binatia bacterium]
MMGLGLVGVWSRPARGEPIRPEDATQHIGEDVVVEGHVSKVVCSPLACLLSFETDFSGLVASIPGDRVAAFPSPRQAYDARRVRIRGTVHENAGRPRIELRDPGQIEVIEISVGVGSTTTSVKEADAASVGQTGDAPSSASLNVGTLEADDALASAPSLDEDDLAAAPAPIATPRESRSRVIDPGRFEVRQGGPRPPRARPQDPSEGLVAELRRGGGETTVELHALREQVARLEQTTRELADMVAALEERLTVLEQSPHASSHVDPSALPEVRPYVVSGDGSSRLAPVKRGWSSERVLRVYGAPLNTVTEPNGYMTWYYANGRAVTIDPRGRVSSSVGF